MLPKNIVLPVVVIFVGVLLLLGNMEIIPAELTAFWPVVLVVGGLVGLTSMDSAQSARSSTPKAKQLRTSSAPAKKKSLPTKRKK